jgi:uncharacterized membrane protein
MASAARLPRLADHPDAEPIDLRAVAAPTADELERWAWLAGGATLALMGLTRRSPTGIGVAAGGGVLIYRGLTGHFPGVGTENRVRVERAVTVNRVQVDVFRAWRANQRLPLLLGEVGTSSAGDEGTLRWIVGTLFGPAVRWDVDVAEERPPDAITWSSAPGALVQQSVSVRLFLAPAGRGTVVHLVYESVLPGGPLGGALAPLGRRLAEVRIREDLRRFKVLLDAGEIPTTEGQPTGGRR